MTTQIKYVLLDAADNICHIDGSPFDTHYLATAALTEYITKVTRQVRQTKETMHDMERRNVLQDDSGVFQQALIDYLDAITQTQIVEVELSYNIIKPSTLPDN